MTTWSPGQKSSRSHPPSPEGRRATQDGKVTVTDKVDYGLISADSHVFEPADLFEKRLPSHLRDRAPQVRDSNGGSAWFVEDVVPVPFPESAVTGSGYRVRDLSNPDRPVTVDEIMPALYDPAERIKAPLCVTTPLGRHQTSRRY